jgi:hypothetical protein
MVPLLNNYNHIESLAELCTISCIVTDFSKFFVFPRNYLTSQNFQQLCILISCIIFVAFMQEVYIY